MKTDQTGFLLLSGIGLLLFFSKKAVADSLHDDTSCDTPCQYIRKYLPYAKNAETIYKIPAIFNLAQAILESNYGQSNVALNANNHFGIKADARWSGPVYQGYRKYDSVQESYDDHSKFLTTNPRYNNIFNDLDPYAFAQAVADAGYSDKPGYAGLIDGVINSVKAAIG